MISFLTAAAITFAACFVAVPVLIVVLNVFGFFTIVPEGRFCVYTIFGRVIAIIREPGLKFLPAHVGLWFPIVTFFGQRRVIDMRLDQEYLRSQPVNSEEGAPMGIGIWYEMYISDPVAFLFRNTDPRGSLAANLSNATVRCLSNMPLERMLEDRHRMSQTVRNEVSEKSQEWGYKVGSVYIRKVHFRDKSMIRQIEAKVVNRLRQVTSAIKQDGANQVSIITSTADRQAAVEFAKAEAIRPAVVGAALNEIGRDPEVSAALFEILEIQKLIESGTKVTIVPPNGGLLPALLASTPPMVPQNAQKS